MSMVEGAEAILTHLRDEFDRRRNERASVEELTKIVAEIAEISVFFPEAQYRPLPPIHDVKRERLN